MAADFTPQERVARVFVTLFDRTPTEAETTAIGPLWNAWLADFGARDPELPLPRNRAYVLPALCASSGGCSTTLWGGARVDFPATLPGSEFDPIYLDDIPDDVNEALRTPGRLFAEQLETYESMADILLNRFLDWDEGERDIRTPGHLFPAVRNHLADVLMETGDLPTIERLILTSVLYTQTAIALDGDGTALDGTGDVLHPLSVGPTKAINAEAWLFSMQNVTSFDIGTGSE